MPQVKLTATAFLWDNELMKRTIIDDAVLAEFKKLHVIKNIITNILSVHSVATWNDAICTVVFEKNEIDDGMLQFCEELGFLMTELKDAVCDTYLEGELRVYRDEWINNTRFAVVFDEIKIELALEDFR